jgi:hypothetical protein
MTTRPPLMAAHLESIRARHGRSALDRVEADRVCDRLRRGSELIGRKVARTDTGLAFAVEAVSVGDEGRVYVLGPRLADGVGAAAEVDAVQVLR